MVEVGRRVLMSTLCSHYSQSNIVLDVVAGTKLTLPSTGVRAAPARIFKTSHHWSICPAGPTSRVKPDYATCCRPPGSARRPDTRLVGRSTTSVRPRSSSASLPEPAQRAAAEVCLHRAAAAGTKRVTSSTSGHLISRIIAGRHALILIVSRRQSAARAAGTTSRFTPLPIRHVTIST